MRRLGMVTAGVGAALAVAVLVLTVRSVPDIRRYLKIPLDVKRRVLVAGIGNVFLGDDGFGPAVARHLVERGDLPDQVRVVDYGIRGLHLAYDLLHGVAALVLVDALPGDVPPGAVSVLEVTGDDLPAVGGLDAHVMDPATVLATLRRLGGTLPPTYVVGCRPATLDEGLGLSPAVAAAVPEAVATVDLLIGKLTTEGT